MRARPLPAPMSELRQRKQLESRQSDSEPSAEHTRRNIPISIHIYASSTLSITFIQQIGHSHITHFLPTFAPPIPRPSPPSYTTTSSDKSTSDARNYPSAMTKRPADCPAMSPLHSKSNVPHTVHNPQPMGERQESVVELQRTGSGREAEDNGRLRKTKIMP